MFYRLIEAEYFIKFQHLLYSNINSLNSENSEKIRKKEDAKNVSETKEIYIKKEEVKDDEGLDKKDRKYYKVIITFSSSSVSYVLLKICLYSVLYVNVNFIF